MKILRKLEKTLKRGIRKNKVIEIPSRAEAISNAIKKLNSGEILLVAGKGHELTQDFGKQKKFTFRTKKLF